MNEPQSASLNPTIFLQLQEEERQRMANALQSGPGQILANTLTEIEYALPLLEKNPQVVQNGLTALRNELRVGLAQLKDLVAELQPPLLDELGLGASIQQYIAKFGERTGLHVDCRGCDAFHTRYPRTIELALFRVLQEALANVAAHAKATHIGVELTRGKNHVSLVVQDNGRGFAPRISRSAKKRQLGLITMRDRVELLGGQLKLFSDSGSGVRVEVMIPYHGLADDFISKGGQATDERTQHHTARSARTSDTGKKETTGSNHHTKPGAGKSGGKQKSAARKTRRQTGG